MLGRPRADCSADGPASPYPRDRRLMCRTGEAALSARARDRSAALRAPAGVEVVVHGRDRDAELLGDHPDPVAGCTEPPSRLDPFGDRVVKARAAHRQPGGSEGVAPGAKVRGHARTAGPVGMFSHPPALSGRSALWMLPRPVLTSRWTAHLDRPVAQRSQDRFVAPASRAARMGKGLVAGGPADSARPAQAGSRNRTGRHRSVADGQSAVTTDFVSR